MLILKKSREPNETGESAIFDTSCILPEYVFRSWLSEPYIKNCAISIRHVYSLACWPVQCSAYSDAAAIATRCSSCYGANHSITESLHNSSELWISACHVTNSFKATKYSARKKSAQKKSDADRDNSFLDSNDGRYSARGDVQVNDRSLVYV